MSTPDVDTIIDEFSSTLSRLGPGLGAPLTRAEHALLKTFSLWLAERQSDEPSETAQAELAPQPTPPPQPE
jgi:hypothetical protein